MADAASTAFHISLTLNVVINVALIVLFGVTYMYIARLETIGCPCAEHPYRSYVRNFALFAIVYLLLTMFNPLFVRKNPILAGLFGLMHLVYTVGAVVFFIFAIKMVQALVKAKCECSQDVRREVLYYWSIIHVALIALIVLVALLGLVMGAVFMSKMPSLKHVSDTKANIAESVRTPQKALSKLPGRFKKLVA